MSDFRANSFSASQEGMVDAGSRRRIQYAKKFAEGNGVDRSRNYYVEVDVQEIVERMLSGSYVVLHGARQTGKTSMVFRAMELIDSQGGNCIYVDFPSYCSTLTTLDDFWRLITQRVFEASDGDLAEPDFSGVDPEAYFRRLFLQKERRGQKDTIVIFDEANHFSEIPNAFKNSFLDNVRHLKQVPKSRLLSLMLVGTASILQDLKIINKYRKCFRIIPSSGNPHSPFSNDGLFVSQNFTQEEVWQLISQFADDKKVKVEREVSDSIWRSTGGRKGLVGVCCSLLAASQEMRHFGHRDIAMWSTFAKKHLIQNVFARPTYNAMWESCCALQGDEKSILLGMLKQGGSFELIWSQNLRLMEVVDFLVAQGVVVDTSDTDGFSMLHFSSDLLHSLMLKQLSVEEAGISVESGPLPFNRLWVIQRTIELLDLDVLLQCNADGYTSEYGLQFEFFVKVKKVLRMAYPYLKWKVIPEAKHDENWRRRLDLYAKDGDDMAYFGFEFLRQGSLASLTEHYSRALWYAEVHNCVVYLINFVLEGEEVEFRGEAGAAVIVYNVIIRGNEAEMRGGWYGDAGFNTTRLRLSDIKSTVVWEFH